jgi:hypothetical protein
MKRHCDRQGDPWIRNQENEKSILAMYQIGYGAAKIANITGEKCSRVESFLKAKGVFVKGTRTNKHTPEMIAQTIASGNKITADRFGRSLV